MAIDEQNEPAEVAATDPVIEYGGEQPVDRFQAELGLPEGFFARDSDPGSAYERGLVWLANERPRRQNHWPALTLALVAQAEDGLRRLGQESLAVAFDQLAIEQVDPNGQPVNTLNFAVPPAGVADDDYVRLRGKYNLALSLILSCMRRNGHPSNPGHATQSWPAYRPLIQLIWEMTPADRRALVEWVWDTGVLPLDETQIVAAVERPVRPFELVLAETPTAEPTRERVAGPLLRIPPRRLTEPAVGVFEGPDREPAVWASR